MKQHRPRVPVLCWFLSYKHATYKSDTTMRKTQTILASLILLFSLVASQAPAWAEEPAEPTASVININTATAEELTTLDGIGESKALAIVADRDTNGPFESGDDLTRVRGIGDATVEKNAGRITTR